VDPDVKIIQMRNDAGQFIARAVMRMLEDEDGVPQLVTETVYSVNPHKRIKKMFDQFVDQKARVMGVQSWNDDKARSGKTIYHRGSRNAYIYTDRGGGKVKKGVFKIQV
jgi:Fe-S-cluster formation regulator IscX/YfhJ